MVRACRSGGVDRRHRSPGLGFPEAVFLAEQVRRDLAGEEDHRKSRARVRAAPDHPHAVDVLEAVLGSSVEHLVEAMGKVEGGPQIDPLGLPVQGCDHLFGSDAGSDALEFADLFGIVKTFWGMC